jgi:F0F1-type ATP synthase assembly protein I
MQPEPKQPRRSPPPTVAAGEFFGVGIQFAGAILLFFFAGRWLDERLGTTPWLLLAGVFVGAGAGFASIYRQLVVVPRQRKLRERVEKT